MLGVESSQQSYENNAAYTALRDKSNVNVVDGKQARVLNSVSWLPADQ